MSEIHMSDEEYAELGIVKCGSCGRYPVREQDGEGYHYLLCDNEECVECGLSEYDLDLSKVIHDWNEQHAPPEDVEEETSDDMDSVLSGVASLLANLESVMERLDSIEKRVAAIETLMRS